MAREVREWRDCCVSRIVVGYSQGVVGRPAPRVNGTAANPMIPISRQVERSSTPQADAAQRRIRMADGTSVPVGVMSPAMAGSAAVPAP